jgi:hypothetical protein
MNVAACVCPTNATHKSTAAISRFTKEESIVHHADSKVETTAPVNDFGSAKIENEDEEGAEEVMGGMNEFLRLIPHLREYGGEAVCS